MKGVVLAGGLGKRLDPLTRVTNKHLLPVFDRPMIHYPIQTLLNAGVDEILIVTGGEHAGDFLKLLGNGKSLGLRDLHYTYQEGEGGIAEALLLAEDFADSGKTCVILGDNIIERNIRDAVGEFFTQPSGARILLKEVEQGTLKGSLRSRGAVDVAAVAGTFGGGGHRNAAGFTTNGTVEETVARITELLS